MKTPFGKTNTSATLDFSAIAKGYGVDVVAEFIASKQINNLFVEIGGEVVCKGKNLESGNHWKLAIIDPNSDLIEPKFIAQLEVGDKAVATSANNFNYRIVDGIKYSHTISPYSGFPIKQEILSATVVTNNCITADALATSFMVMGHEKAIELLKQNTKIDAFLIFSDGEGKTSTYVTPGIENQLKNNRMIKNEWFGEWFDSPYYHILYQHRDHTEAKHFIDNLAEHLHFSAEDLILDLACGKGRHSIYLNELGYDVVGIDLSAQNIAFANQFANSRLHFLERDMRKDFNCGPFDFVLNLFTSFGYFDTSEENMLAINNIKNALKPGGFLVLDFLNPYIVVNELIAQEHKIVEGIEFNINKIHSDDGFIIKNIEFEHDGDTYEFHEKVKAIRRVEFLDYFKQAELTVVDIFW